MATFLLVSALVHATPGGDFVNNDVVNVYWNSSSQQIEVTKNGSPFSVTSASQIGALNTNYYVSGITSYEGDYAISGYSFCNGDDLNWFKMLKDYPMPPYMQKQVTVDSPVCTIGGPVCDIHWTAPRAQVDATSLTNPDGSYSAIASSSNGTVKYALYNFDYATEGQTSGTFTGLSPGLYDLYAKDPVDCTLHVTFFISYKPAQVEHYRFSWRTVPIGQGTSYDARLRIYDREYVGDMVEIDHGDESPFRLAKPRSSGHLNDKFYPIHTSSAVLNLISQEDYYFLPLFTQDDQKYRCVYEINTSGTWEEIWQGFIPPSVYREDFISVPYSVEIQITDNIKKLEKIPFADSGGELLFGSMKLIKVISFIMQRTGLNLKIRSGINIFEANHNTAATDDPLDQTYVDVASYRKGNEPFTCAEVLEKVLRPFGARILQSDNQWLIEEIDRAYQGYAYRVFTADGVYESNSTYDPVMDVKGSSYTDRVAPADEDQGLEVIPAYGKITVTSELNYVGSIVAGGFEKEDLLSPESEVTTFFPGIFKSEEGFRDWGLKQPPGISGVSFGRVVIDNENIPFKHIVDADLATEGKKGRSVGAFFFTASGWSGNLRDAYIESTAKPFQYGPNDEVRIRFAYSTPGGDSGYPFMILRFALKIGNKYLQQDLTWDTTEWIFRTYPQISSSLQNFEMFVKTPTASTVTDSTIQLRIYYYAKDFYEFGLPSATSSPADGTSGIADLVAFPTVDIDRDFKVDVREHTSSDFIRMFAELRVSTAATDLESGILRVGDYDGSTNTKIWWILSGFMENNKTLDPQGHNSRDRLFYIDDVNVDAFVNGQTPPTEDTIELKISSFINETLEVPLYNFDLPDVRNGKNMYNNYFRLSDGTPTALWARSGVDESLPIQKILLKILGANHSAPTFRVTGTFINEFQRIGPKNYLRITKPGSNLSAVNTEFDSDLSSWTGDGSGAAFVWTASNSGSAEVTLNGAVNSEKFYQGVSQIGGYVQITISLKAIPTTGNDREDILHVLFYKDSKIIHTEKLKTVAAVSSERNYLFTHTAFVPKQVNRVGFFFQRVAGVGQCAYQISQFKTLGTPIQEVYQIADYQSNERKNEYNLELMQISKQFISLAGVDTGGTNQSGGETGREHSSAYSSAYS